MQNKTFVRLLTHCREDNRAIYNAEIIDHYMRSMPCSDVADAVRRDFEYVLKSTPSIGDYVDYDPYFPTNFLHFWTQGILTHAGHVISPMWTPIERCRNALEVISLYCTRDSRPGAEKNVYETLVRVNNDGELQEQKDATKDDSQAKIIYYSGTFYIAMANRLIKMKPGSGLAQTLYHFVIIHIYLGARFPKFTAAIFIIVASLMGIPMPRSWNVFPKQLNLVKGAFKEIEKYKTQLVDDIDSPGSDEKLFRLIEQIGVMRKITDRLVKKASGMATGHTQERRYGTPFGS